MHSLHEFGELGLVGLLGKRRFLLGVSEDYLLLGRSALVVVVLLLITALEGRWCIHELSLTLVVRVLLLGLDLQERLPFSFQPKLGGIFVGQFEIDPILIREEHILVIASRFILSHRGLRVAILTQASRAPQSLRLLRYRKSVARRPHILKVALVHTRLLMAQGRGRGPRMAGIRPFI